MISLCLFVCFIDFQSVKICNAFWTTVVYRTIVRYWIWKNAQKTLKFHMTQILATTRTCIPEELSAPSIKDPLCRLSHWWHFFPGDYMKEAFYVFAADFLPHSAWSRQRIEKDVPHTCKIYTRAAPKIMPPIYYVGPQCQRWMLVVWKQRLNLLTNILLHVVVLRQMAAEGQSDKMASDMEVCMEQRHLTEFLRGKNGTHWHPLMFAERWWRPNSGYELREAVSSAFQQWYCNSSCEAAVKHWCRFVQRWHAGFAHHWQKCIGGDYMKR